MAAPLSNEDQEESPSSMDMSETTDDTEYDIVVEIQAGNDLESSQSDDDLPNPFKNMTEEEAWKKFLSTAYERGSKKPMKAPLNVPWGLPVSDGGVEKLSVGYKSRSTDNKWDLLIEDPDENGGFSLHILRNWLQEECYVLHVVVSKPKSDEKGDATDAAGDRSRYGAEIQSITWEGNKAGLQCSAEQAQKEAVILARGWLHCELEALPHYPTSMLWDSSGYIKLDEGGSNH